MFVLHRVVCVFCIGSTPYKGEVCVCVLLGFGVYTLHLRLTKEKMRCMSVCVWRRGDSVCVCVKKSTQLSSSLGGGGGGGENKQPSTSSGNQGQALESASLGASDPHPMKEKMRCATPCVWRREDSVCGRGLLC